MLEEQRNRIGQLEGQLQIQQSQLKALRTKPHGLRTSLRRRQRLLRCLQSGMPMATAIRMGIRTDMAIIRLGLD